MAGIFHIELFLCCVVSAYNTVTGLGLGQVQKAPAFLLVEPGPFLFSLFTSSGHFSRIFSFQNIKYRRIIDALPFIGYIIIGFAIFSDVFLPHYMIREMSTFAVGSYKLWKWILTGGIIFMTLQLLMTFRNVSKLS